MDAHGGWLASAVDLVRFAASFDSPQACPILGKNQLDTMFSRPDSTSNPYYGCGWQVRILNNTDQRNTWHTGGLSGTSTLLVRRYDRTNWAVLFNSRVGKSGRELAAAIDRNVHTAADQVKRWPNIDRFPDLL